MVDFRSEPQIVQNFSIKQIAARRCFEVVLTHILCSVDRAFKVEGQICSVGFGNVEENDVGMMISHYVQAMFVRCLEKKVVGIDKLNILSSTDSYTGVSGIAESRMGQSDVDKLIGIGLQVR